MCRGLLSRLCGTDIFCHHGHLLAHGCHCLGICCIHDVTEAPDIAVLLVLQSLRIDIEPSGLIGESAASNKIRGMLRWADMKHIELFAHAGFVAVTVGYVEPSLFIRAIDFNEVVIKAQRSVVFFNVRHQRFNIGGDAEQQAAGITKIDINVVDGVVFVPVVGGQVECFLWRASALNGHGGLGKYRLAMGGLLDQFPCVRREIIAVV